MVPYEAKAFRQGYRYVIGVDEAGRGPLAGPVVSAAVCLKSKTFRTRIADSKQITARQREKAFNEIYDKAFVGIGVISEQIIDSINILQATYQAMNLAVRHLAVRLALDTGATSRTGRTAFLLVDGRAFETELPFPFKAIIDGDAKCLSIACASIVAKVTRDRILDMYDQLYPQYGFKKHKGYATRAHRLAIRRFGLSRIHRKTFRSRL